MARLWLPERKRARFGAHVDERTHTHTYIHTYIHIYIHTYIGNGTVMAA